MIICRNCGGQNGDSDDFCGVCGRFLEWDGVRTAPEPDDPALAVAPPEDRPGLIERVKDAIVGDPKAPAPPAPATGPPAPAPPPVSALPPPPAAGPPPGGAGPPPAAGTPPIIAPPPPSLGGPAQPFPVGPGTAPTGAGAAPELDPATQRAAALVAKAPIATPDGPAPGQRLPGQAERKRKVVTPPAAARIRPGDLICGTCGTGNDPERKFCRVDGTSLAEAVQQKYPWWWRFKPKKKVRAAGERPQNKTESGKARRGFWAIVRIATAVALVIALIAALGPWDNPLQKKWDDAYASLRRRFFPKYDQVIPEDVQATAEIPEHPAVDVADLSFETYWSPGGSGIGQSVVFVFDEPVTLGKVIFGNGGSDDYTNKPRVQTVWVSYDNGNGLATTCPGKRPWCHEITLKDNPKPQEHDMRSKRAITSVRITIGKDFPAEAGDVALSEVQFFAIR